ncbi:MAG: class I SAM-dependent methyltransferase [bacterium]
MNEGILDEELTARIRRRYDRNAPLYDACEALQELLTFRKWRKRVWDEVVGERVLEVGIGTGRNIPYHPADKSIVGIDFSPKMLKRARRRWPGRDLRLMDAQSMEFPDDSFDSVVSTFVFCSVPDALLGLKEVRRVCRPGGQVVMLEHVRSKSKILGPLMDLLNPLFVSLTGSNINRDTVENARRAGLRVIREENLWGDVVKLIVAEPIK